MLLFYCRKARAVRKKLVLEEPTRAQTRQVTGKKAVITPVKKVAPKKLPEPEPVVATEVVTPETQQAKGKKAVKKPVKKVAPKKQLEPVVATEVVTPETPQAKGKKAAVKKSAPATRKSGR